MIVIYCDPSSTHIQHCSKHNSKYPNKSMENLKISYLLKKEKTYSFICKTLLERGRGKGRQTDLPYFSSLSNSQGCSQELHQSPALTQGPNTQDIIHYIPRNISRKWDWKWSTQDSNRSLYRTLVLQHCTVLAAKWSTFKWPLHKKYLLTQYLQISLPND